MFIGHAVCVQNDCKKQSLTPIDVRTQLCHVFNALPTSQYIYMFRIRETCSSPLLMFYLHVCLRKYTPEKVRTIVGVKNVPIFLGPVGFISHFLCMCISLQAFF